MSSRPIISLRLSKKVLDNLIRCQYETVKDLVSVSNETLAKDLGISVEEAEEILQQVQAPPTRRSDMPFTQSAAVIISRIRKFSTRIPQLDHLLGGGLTRGHVVDISGPPGSQKEYIVINIIASFLQAKESAIFVDCQNMASPAKLHQSLSTMQELPPDFSRALKYIKILDFATLVVFLHSLNALSESTAEVTLLVLNSLSFPLEVLSNARNKTGVQDHMKQILTRLVTSKNLTIVITSQLATKMIRADGFYGSFSEGAKGILVPQLDTSYLPSGRAHRIMLSLESPTSGKMHILPSISQRFDLTNAQCIPYTIANGYITTEGDHQYPMP